MRHWAWLLLLTAGGTLLGGLAPSASAPLRLLMHSRGQGEQAARLAACVDTALGRQLVRLYACAEVSRDSAVASRLSEAARQKLLGADVRDPEWPALVGPLSIRYVLTTRVTLKPRSLQVASNLVRASNGKVITGQISNLAKEAGFVECERFAESFARQLRYVPAFSSDSCPPAKP